MYNNIIKILNLQQDLINHKSNLYITIKVLLGSFGKIYINGNVTYIWLTIYNNINISNRCNVHPEDRSVTTSKVMVNFEIWFSRAKHDINKLFYLHLLSNGNIFYNFSLTIL